MDRIPEPELMDDPAQALAYARADFEEPHNHFVDLFVERFGSSLTGSVVDLGCGPGDICRRFARRFTECRITGLDAAPAMLELAATANREQGMEDRIRYIHGYLPDAALPPRHYDAVISNSLLHHLKDPASLWANITRLGRPGAMVFVMDLMRPGSREDAQRLVRQYADGEPRVLQNDFFNSLLAAYRPPEVEEQLAGHGLGCLSVEIVSDRHLIVFGRLK